MTVIIVREYGHREGYHGDYVHGVTPSSKAHQRIGARRSSDFTTLSSYYSAKNRK